MGSARNKRPPGGLAENVQNLQYLSRTSWPPSARPLFPSSMHPRSASIAPCWPVPSSLHPHGPFLLQQTPVVAANFSAAFVLPNPSGYPQSILPTSDNILLSNPHRSLRVFPVRAASVTSSLAS